MTDTDQAPKGEKVYTDRMAAARAARRPYQGQMKSFTFRIPVQLRDDIRELALADGRTPGNYARILLARHAVTLLPEGRTAKEKPILVDRGGTPG